MYTKITHAIAGAMTTLAAFYAVSGDFRSWVGQLVSLYSAHVPHLLQPVPALAVALWMWYRNGKTSSQSSDSLSLSGKVGSGLSVLLLIAIMTGCQSYEESARDALAASQGYLNSAISIHMSECLASSGQLPVCETLRKAAFAQNATVTALQIYCGWAPGTPKDAKCEERQDAKNLLVSALGNLNKISAEIKAAAK